MRGKGIGSAVLQKLIKIVFDEMKFNKMKTMVLENNKIAINLYKKFGFKKIGKLNKKLKRNSKELDVFIMEISKDDIK
jgi:RimJ/RimL family protein N-acetyltransferase